jgi:hypothetical protein
MGGLGRGNAALFASSCYQPIAESDRGSRGLVGTYPHTMTITDWDAASEGFSGLIYTGSNRGSTARQIGLIDANGAVSGTATTSQNQTHDWTATRRP